MPDTYSNRKDALSVGEVVSIPLKSTSGMKLKIRHTGLSAEVSGNLPWRPYNALLRVPAAIGEDLRGNLHAVVRWPCKLDEQDNPIAWRWIGIYHRMLSHCREWQLASGEPIASLPAEQADAIRAAVKNNPLNA
jgi:hypothetical protein